MSFENLFEEGGDDSSGMQFPYYDDYFTTSPVFSLGLDNDAAGDMGADGAMEGDADAENDSRSESDPLLDPVSGGGEEVDDFEPGNNNSSNRKRSYHRHTPRQIRELEALFKECPHPEEKQRAELSKRLGLDPRQVKFWFQNRRTQLKTQLERYENALLKQEHERLMTRNKTLKETMVRGPLCVRCGSPATPGVLSLEEQRLLGEHAQLNADIDRVSALATKLLGKPISALLDVEEEQVQPDLQPPSMPRSSLLDLSAVGGLGHPMGTLPSAAMVPAGTMSGFAAGLVSSPLGTVITAPAAPAAGAAPPPPPTVGIDRTMLLELAISSMDELVKMAQMDEPLWLKTMPGSPNKEMLNLEQYALSFVPWMGTKPVGFVSDASRDSGIVINCNSAALVDTLMDEKRWSDMFPCMIAKARTLDEISTGIAGSRNGNLLLMKAEIQVLSPLVPIREVKFIRYCKQLAEGAWAIVDASIDGLVTDQNSATTSAAGNAIFRRLPSGCVIQDTPNGYCKVTWVEHTEYDEASVHQLYRPLLRCGLAFGAKRWLANLQSQCESLVFLMSPETVSANGPSGAVITQEGKRSMLELARRMTGSFCAGVNASSARDWIKLDCAAGILGEDVHVLARKSVNEPGEPPGVVLSVATSVWVPVAREKLFNFLRNERLRAEWDILSNGGPMQEMANLAKGPQGSGNSVSLLRATAVTSNQLSSLLILQETCTDASGYMVVYAPVDIPEIQLVMNGGDSTYVTLLPSGFVIMPDGPGIDASGIKIGGSLLTAAFQILVNSQPTSDLTLESVETVNNLISCTIKKIKSALRGGTGTST